MKLADLQPCFQGIIPGLVATCDAAGEPNVTYLSQVHWVDEAHVALSCQFFNKTRRNVAQNPQVTVLLQDPRDFEGWKLRLRFVRSDYAGPLFDSMSARIEMIASHTGMAGVFRLLSADIYEVLAVELVVGLLEPAPDSRVAEPDVVGPLTELRGLQSISARIARACDLDSVLHGALAALDEVFGFSHGMILLPDESGRRLVALAAHGYDDKSVGGEVGIGEGVLGSVAEQRRMVRIATVGSELRYGRAIRSQLAAAGEGHRLSAEIPLPGLADAQALLALPLLSGDQLMGVLAVESRDPLRFDDWDEAFLQIVANQVAVAIDRMLDRSDDEAELDVETCPDLAAAGLRGLPRRVVTYYRNDDCVFVDGEYLIRNVPGKILWKLLRQHEAGRHEFTNRELRLDDSLGLPAYKDNLESRLILLRRRLESKCPELRMVPIKRGRFALEVRCALELVEN